MIRILALIAAITASVSATTQIRNTIPALVVLVQARFSGTTLRLAPFFLLMCVSALALPVVCFSLWFNRGELRVSITLRIVSVIGATVLLGIFIADLRGRLPRFDLTGAASWLLHSALILLLIAFARHRSRDANPMRPYCRSCGAHRQLRLSSGPFG